MDSKDRKRILKGMIQDGYTVIEIAEDWGVSRTTIYHYLKLYNLPYPRVRNTPTVDEERLRKLEKLLRKRRGCSINELAESLDVSKETIYRDFHRLADKKIYIERVGMTRPTLYRIVI